MDCVNEVEALQPYAILRAALNVPFWHYVVGFTLFLAYAVYNFLEIHLIGDLVFGMGRNSVRVICDPASKIATQLLPKCQILKERYWPTPWLCSPHLQTAFLHFFGRPPVLRYQRQIFLTPDGETIALDWVINNVDRRPASLNTPSSGNDLSPIVIVVPGLTSDSEDPYVKHIVYYLAEKGWKVVVANHRGLGGTFITSDHFYNAGWTEDLRRIVGYLHHENPKAPLLAVGTSIGANILVKYLGEEGKNTPLAGGAAVCCPWDLVVCDRFINRRLIQRVYNKILTTGLRGYAQMHQSTHARIADWECVKKSRSVRDFDNFFTCRISKYSTVDTYYRKCSSAYFLSNVSVPLLCVNALDDPVCTREAIPWDECRVNENVVLATTLRGGHLAYFEGLTAGSIWWVRAVKEFLSVLHSSSLMHSEKEDSGLSSTLFFPIDKGPYLNVTHDGMVSAHDSSYMQSQQDVEDIIESEVNISPKSPAKILDQNRYTDDKQPRLALDSYQSVKELMLAKGSSKEESNVANCNSEEKSMLEKGRSEEESKLAKGRNEEECGLKHSDEGTGSTFKLCIKGKTECIALQSALQQLVEQMQASSKGEAMSNTGARFSESKGLSQSRVSKEPDHTKPGSYLAMCNSGVCEDMEGGSSIKQSVQKQRGGDDVSKASTPIAKRIMHLSRPQRCSIWALAYISLVTAWPLVGSVLMLNLRKRFKNVWSIAGARK